MGLANRVTRVGLEIKVVLSCFFNCSDHFNRNALPMSFVAALNCMMAIGPRISRSSGTYEAIHGANLIAPHLTKWSFRTVYFP